MPSTVSKQLKGALSTPTVRENSFSEVTSLTTKIAEI
jgi:hypothetical protein